MSVQNNQLNTDDLAFSAWLRMRGYPLIRSHKLEKKSIFSFSIKTEDENTLKIEFLNSDYLDFYNEVRNLKKII
ncbi:MAG: hypothetical protein HQ510_02940 [Candidatus Marinimicrobia bacterium]|nr:hypothetical protein [Candidatus Neomarinimicrobiota bacterium]